MITVHTYIDNYPVIINDKAVKKLGSPFASMRRNRIYIHSKCLIWDEKILSAVLWHEAGHLRCGDGLNETAADEYAVRHGYGKEMIVFLQFFYSLIPETESAIRTQVWKEFYPRITHIAKILHLKKRIDKKDKLYWKTFLQYASLDMIENHKEEILACGLSI